MPDPPRFANYPLAQEGPQVEYAPKQDSNPALRGLPLAFAVSIISAFPFVQRHLWNNAGFGTVKDLKDLNGLRSRYDPCVIPLGGSSFSPSSSTVSSSTSSSADQPHIPFSSARLTPPPPTLPGRYHTAADFHAAYQSGAITPLDVVNALLPLTHRSAAAAATPTTKFETMFVDSHGLGDDIVLAAARASTERWASGTQIGPLDGVPFAVKDDTPVRGWVSHCGMKYDPRQQCFEPEEETMWHVSKLEEAGAIMVAKTNMHELGCDTTGCNPVWGTPPNWHNDAYYPGGSSSGAGSACSVGLFPITIGGDAGGSLRIPATFNGVYTIKPSHHRCAVLSSTMAVVGPMAATAQDLVLAYRTMAQSDPDCPVQGTFCPSIPPSPSAKKYVGIYQPWWDRADPRVTSTCTTAISWLSTHKNYEIVPIYIPYVDVGQLAHGGTCLAEMADEARSRANNPNEWLGLVSPATRLLLMVGAQTPAGDYLKYGALRELLMQHLAFLFQEYPGMLVVTPTTAVTGWKRTPGDETHGVSDGNATIKAMTYIWLANSTGCPAVSVPVGTVEPDAGEGRLPVGLMAMGEWGSEEQLLEWAGEAEEYLHGSVEGGRARPAEWVDVIERAKELKKAP